jgi:ubiquinone/menaquinone biosynthesis C-methylase UbiE
MKNFHETSYKLHSQAYTETDDESIKKQQTWFDENTVDYWRHFRMVQPLTPLLKYYSNSSCVTIGDGRFGLDSIKLRKIEPSLNVLPTDIAAHLLQQAKEKNIINDFRIENAEKLTFTSNQFDLSFCIESYHHFPRPYLALYEMIRVSRKAVVFIEPNDPYCKPIPRRLIDLIKATIQSIRKKKNQQHPEHLHFEESGNYVFTVSKREMEKIAIGLQLPAVAFYYFNDYYEQGVEFERQSSSSRLFKRVQRKIKLSNLKCRLGLSNHGNLITVLLKEKPSPDLRFKLKDVGFEIIDLPVNPHLKDYSYDQKKAVLQDALVVF